MKFVKSKFVNVMLLCGLATVSLPVLNSHAQQPAPATAPGAASDMPATTVEPADAPDAASHVAATVNNQSMTVEHDKVRTSAEHLYNSPAERANDDLLITEVKSSLAEQGISDRYPVEVDCDHGTIQLSGVVASADDARQAQSIAMNTRGVVGVKNKLTWR